MPTVAVVILNYNGKNYLERFLAKVLKYSQPHAIYVADNASTDDSIHFLQKYYPQITLITLPANTGYAGGYKEALKQIKADYFVLLNSDVEVTENWIDPVIQVLEGNEKIIACQPKIKSYHQKSHFEYAGGAGGFIDFLGYPFCRGRIFSTLEKDVGQYNDTIEVFWATGACLFLKADAYFELGGLDPDFFAHMEEIDFCWRAKNQGYKVFYCAESTVYHVGGGTLEAENPFKTFLNFRNNLLMLYKNLSAVEFAAIYQKRQILDSLAALQFFLTGKAKNATAVYKAHTAFRGLKRNYSSTEVPGLAHEQIYKNSLLKDYYMNGLKKFDQLKAAWKI
ncbi:MAG: GT2 family glycosyltransferase [Marivirga sp.]|jgi:GT2 family glycosyltransferase